MGIDKMLNQCLICYRSPTTFDSTYSQNNPESSETRKRFFILASRYLNFTCEYVKPDKTLIRSGDVRVDEQTFCSNCYPLMESFCDMYDLVQLLQLELKWKLQQIEMIIRASDGESTSESSRNRRSLEEKLDRIGSSLSEVDDFRARFVMNLNKKCDFPELRVRRVKISPPLVNPAAKVKTERAHDFEHNNIPDDNDADCDMPFDNDSMSDDLPECDLDAPPVLFSETSPAEPESFAHSEFDTMDNDQDDHIKSNYATIEVKNTNLVMQVVEEDMVKFVPPAPAVISRKPSRPKAKKNIHRRRHQKSRRKQLTKPSRSKRVLPATKTVVVKSEPQTDLPSRFSDDNELLEEAIESKLQVEKTDLSPELDSALPSNSKGLKPSSNKATRKRRKRRGRPSTHPPKAKVKKAPADFPLGKKPRKKPCTRPKIVQCGFCGKRFCDPAWLFQHEKTHTGDTSLKCKVCSKYFIRKEHLIKHERIHTGDRPFVCEICGKGFTQLPNCERHVREVHAAKEDKK